MKGEVKSNDKLIQLLHLVVNKSQTCTNALNAICSWQEFLLT